MRILLVWDHVPPSRLELEALASSLATQDIALDVITAATAEAAWATLTSCAFGQVWVQRKDPMETFNDYLVNQRSIVLEGIEVRARGLVGIGPHWRAGRITLPPLRKNETHYLRLRCSSHLPESPRVEVRFRGLGYLAIPPLPDHTATQVV